MPANLFEAVLRHSYAAVRSSALATNYYLNRYKEVVWVVGDGRSGTTWLADIVNWQTTYREMLEPFHPAFVKAMGRFGLFKYMRPDEEDELFREAAKAVFTGRLLSRRVDSENRIRFYNGLLIKDIFAHLFVRWALAHFPYIKLVVIVRNPFAVALSKLGRQHWVWMTDPKDFLKQPTLVEDYLRPFEPTISNVEDDYVIRQVLIWAIIHHVLFRQLSDAQVHLVFYESLCRDPRSELVKLFRYLGAAETSEELPSELLGRLKMPSRFSRVDSTITSGESLTDSWRDKISAHQIDMGRQILCKFGLDQIYGESGVPNEKSLKQMLVNCGEDDNRIH